MRRNSNNGCRNLVIGNFKANENFWIFKPRLLGSAIHLSDQVEPVSDTSAYAESHTYDLQADQPASDCGASAMPMEQAATYQATELQADLDSLQDEMPDQRYQLLEVLGRGGSGLVVLALDTKISREVAIKFLVQDSESARQRLRREGQILAELDHPNIVRIFDIGELDNKRGSGGTQFLVMEYMAGGSAANRDWGQESSYRELARMLQGSPKVCKSPMTKAWFIAI